MSGSITDTWTSPARHPDGSPVLDARGRPVRTRNERWGRGDRWLVRWYDEGGQRRNQRAPNKDAAQAILDGLAVARANGTSTDPARGRRTVGHYADRWLQVAASKPSARSWNHGAVRSHIRPRWGAVSVADVTTAAVREWAAQLARTPNGRGGVLSASRRRGLLLALGAILDLAVDDRALARNPARGVDLPKVTLQRGQRVEVAAIHRLLDELRARYAGAEVAALLQAFAGPRWGEVVALDVADYLRQPSPRLRIDDAIVEVEGRLEPGPTKSHAEREAPLPPFVARRLEEWIGDRTSGPLVPGPRGGRYRRGTWRRHWEAATEAAGMTGMRPHQLRHAAASLAIASGADVKVVAAMLGHADATLTMNVYGHLLTDRLDEVSSRMEAFAPAQDGHMGPSVGAANRS